CSLSGGRRPAQARASSDPTTAELLGQSRFPVAVVPLPRSLDLEKVVMGVCVFGFVRIRDGEESVGVHGPSQVALLPVEGQRRFPTDARQGQVEIRDRYVVVENPGGL